ncbi:hypothetical protein U9M48_034588 [Paspalum notatum var. saurae]|uniref:Dof zinc finger protein n=1 Tax=Paspalum notatum var. saurae TaxID=547442 RepID=A0AAQ3X754_PASNO
MEGRNGMPKQQAKAQQAAAVASRGGELKQRPHHNEALRCPRCDSTNTKFCYYNNYSTTQPRYLCKACRRYWTQGGTLRDVPIGGNSRKNKHSSAALSSSAAAASSSSTTSSATMVITSSTHQLMMMMHTPTMTMDYPGTLPTFMSTSAVGESLEEHHVPLPFAPLSLSSNEAPGGSVTTASFLDMLGFLDDGNNSRSNGNGMVMEHPLPPFDAMPMQATQLAGPLQGQEVSNATTGGLLQWSSAQHRSFNDGGFVAGSSSTRVQQQKQQVGDHGGHQHEHKVTLMDYWTNNNGASRGPPEQLIPEQAESEHPDYMIDGDRGATTDQQGYCKV